MKAAKIAVALEEVQENLRSIQNRLLSICDGIDGTGTADQIEEVAAEVQSLREATQAFNTKIMREIAEGSEA